MSKTTSRRTLCQALFLIAAIMFQSMALPGRGVAFADAPDNEKKTDNAPAVGPQERPSAPALPQRTPVPNAPQAASITASNRDSFPNHGDGKAHQGDTITYSVAITNTGDANATGVNYADTIDVNTSTLVGGSPLIQFTVAGDTYSALGNVKIDTATIAPGSGKTVLENDTTNSATLTGFGSTLANANGTVPNGSNTVTTTNNGTVTMNADGSFTFTPSGGFTGADSFWYTLTKNTIGTGLPTGFPSGAAKVTINVSTPLWFVDQSAGAGGNGTLTTPFNCLTGAGCFSAVNDGGAGHPKAGDFIFLYKSAGAPAAFTGGVTLLNNQKLIGEGASASLATIAGVSLPPGSAALPSTGNAPPVVTTAIASTNGINIGVGNSNTLRGFNIGNTTGAKIASGANFGTLAVSEMTLSGTGAALNLTSGALAATFANITSTSAAGAAGISLATISGSFTVSGTTAISNTGNEGIKITGSSLTANFGTTNVTSPGLSSISISSTTGNITFGVTTLTNGIEGVNLNGNSGGTRTFASLSISGVTGNAFNHSNNGAIGGGDVTVTGATNISCAGNAISVSAPANGDLLDFQGATSSTVTAAGPTAVNWSGATGATMQFSALTIQTNGGIGLNATTGGTINVTNNAGTINNATEAAAAIIANGIALNANFTAIKSSGGTNGVSLTNVTGTSNFGGGTLSGASGDEFLISGQNGTFTYNGTIASGSAHSVNVTGKTGGTVTFGGAINDTDTGITLTSNTNATINFTGALSLTTTTNAAFTATGGGTISATDANSAVITTTGTAVNVTNTTISSSNLTFKSISSNGGNNGIILNNTGALGSLLVTGTGSAGSGGTLQNMTGGDASPVEIATIGVGIYLNSTKSPSFNWMSLHDCSNYAVVGTTVNGFTMTNSVVNGTNGTNQGGVGEGDVYFTGLSGSATVTNCTFTGAIYDAFHVLNNASQTLNRITITGSTFATVGGAGNLANDALVFQGTGGTLNMTVQNSFFTSARGDLFNLDLHGVIASDLVFTGNTLTNNNANIVSGGGGFTMQGGGAGNQETFTFNISNNTMRDALGGALNIGAGTGAGTNHNYSGTIDNNTIGVIGVTDSGSKQGSDIFINFNAAGTGVFNLTNNKLYQYGNGNGINLNMGAFGSSNPYIQLNVTGNTISNPGTFGAQGILLTAGTGPLPETGRICMTLGGAGLANVLTGSGGAGAPGTEVRIRDRFDVKVGFPGYGGSPTDTNALATYIQGRNTVTNLAAVSVAAPSAGTTNGTTNGFYQTCPPPLLLAMGGVSSARDVFSLMQTVDSSGFSSVDVSQNATASISVSNSLDQKQLDSVVAAALQRWKATGLTPKQLAALQSLRFEVSDLVGSYLGIADGNRIQVSRDAQGEGWFVPTNPQSDALFAHALSATRRYTNSGSAPAGHVDLLTAVEHEMGHRLGLPDTYAAKDRNSIMYGYLTVGERRLPARGEAGSAQANNLHGSHFLRIAEVRHAASSDVKRKGMPGLRPQSLGTDNKPASPQSGGTVNLSVGTITPGSTVVLTYQVTVNNTAPPGASTLSNQGTVTSSAPTVTTDDPDVGGANDPTVTPLLHPTAANGRITGRITDSSGNPVEGAVVSLSGGQSRKLITDANGNYIFDNVDTGGFYTVTPTRANFNFNPFNRSFSQSGNKTEAAFTGTSMGDNANPLETAEYFVRQQYVAILGREPEEAGFNYWSDQILGCGADAECTNARRRDVAASFFMSEEFQASGSYIYDAYAGSLGRGPGFGEYANDRQQVVGGETLEAAKVAFAQNFVRRADFLTKYQNAMTAEGFVDALLQSVHPSGVDLEGERSNLIAIYNQGADLVTNRAAVLKALADNATFKQSQYNQSFVLMEYFAYLRRDAEPEGYTFWVTVLNTGDPNNYRGMVCSFITSTEYQRRFSTVVSHSNGECGN